MTFPEDRLRTGLPATEAKAFARDTVRNPAWVDELIALLPIPRAAPCPARRRGCCGMRRWATLPW